MVFNRGLALRIAFEQRAKNGNNLIWSQQQRSPPEATHGIWHDRNIIALVGPFRIRVSRSFFPNDGLRWNFHRTKCEPMRTVNNFG